MAEHQGGLPSGDASSTPRPRSRARGSSGRGRGGRGETGVIASPDVQRRILFEQAVSTPSAGADKQSSKHHVASTPPGRGTRGRGSGNRGAADGHQGRQQQQQQQPHHNHHQNHQQHHTPRSAESRARPPQPMNNSIPYRTHSSGQRGAPHSNPQQQQSDQNNMQRYDVGGRTPTQGGRGLYDPNQNSARGCGRGSRLHSGRNGRTTPDRGADSNSDATPNGHQQQQQRRQFTPGTDGKARKQYEEHITQEQAEQGLSSGILLRGGLRINAKNYQAAYVTVEDGAMPCDVFIDTQWDRNRGLDGDIVVIELLPQEKWKAQGGGECTDNNHDSSLPVYADDAVSQRLLTFGYGMLICATTTVAAAVCCCCSGPADATLGDAMTAIDADELDLILSEDEQDSDIIGLTLSAAATAQAEQTACDIQLEDELWRPLKGLATGSVQSKPQPAPLCEAGVIAKSCGLQPRGKVVYIWKRQQRGPYCGALQPFSPLVPGREGKLQLSNEDSSVLFKPLDGRAPALLVNMRLLPRQYVDNPAEYKLGLFAATIDKYWPANSKMPRAQNVVYLGQGGDITAETRALLMANNVNHGDFSQEVLKSLAPLLPAKASKQSKSRADTAWTIPEEEIAKRKDLRDYRIFTIDPPTAKDLDDAMHVTLLDDGTIEIGVHIADVSYFVTPDTPLDAEALHRATT
eukprot:21189-Heterococcus_DN1.PRE.1